MIILRRVDMTDKDIERFWSKVDKSGDCWEWTAHVLPNRYGRMRFRGKIVYAHRFAYALAHGECANNLVIDHRCRNKRCVNPSHLQLVTIQRNCENVGASKNSKTGIRGVCWHAATNKWEAYARVKRKKYYGGRYSDIHEAEKAAIALRNKLMVNNLIDRVGRSGIRD